MAFEGSLLVPSRFFGPEHQQSHEKYVIELEEDSESAEQSPRAGDPTAICLMCCIHGLFNSASRIASINLLAALEDDGILVAILNDSHFSTAVASTLFNHSISADDPQISLKSLVVLLGGQQPALRGMQRVLHEMLISETIIKVQTTQIGSPLHHRILSNTTFLVAELPHMRYSLLLQHCGLIPRLIQVELQSGSEESCSQILHIVWCCLESLPNSLQETCLRRFSEALFSSCISFLQTNLAARSPHLRIMVLEIISHLCSVFDDVVERCAFDRNSLAVLRSRLVDVDEAVRSSATEFFLNLADADDTIRTAIVSEGLLEHAAEALRLTSSSNRQSHQYQDESSELELIEKNLMLLNHLFPSSLTSCSFNMSAITFIIKFCCGNSKNTRLVTASNSEQSVILLSNVLQLPECDKNLPDEEWINILALVHDMASSRVFLPHVVRILGCFFSRLKSNSRGQPSQAVITAAEGFCREFMMDANLNHPVAEIILSLSPWVDCRNVQQRLVDWLRSCAIPILKTNDVTSNITRIWITAASMRLRRAVEALVLDRAVLDHIDQACSLLSESDVIYQIIGAVFCPNEAFQRDPCCLFTAAALKCLMVSLRLSQTGDLLLNKTFEELAESFLNLERDMGASSITPQSIEAVTELSFCAACTQDQSAVRYIVMPLANIMLEALCHSQNEAGFGMSPQTLCRLCAVCCHILDLQPQLGEKYLPLLHSSIRAWRISAWGTAESRGLASPCPPLVALASCMIASPTLASLNKINLLGLMRFVRSDEDISKSDAASWIICLSDNVQFTNLILSSLPSAIPKEICEREQFGLVIRALGLILRHEQVKLPVKHDIALQLCEVVAKWAPSVGANWVSVDSMSAGLSHGSSSQIRWQSDTQLILQLVRSVTRLDPFNRAASAWRVLLCSLSELWSHMRSYPNNQSHLWSSILMDLAVSKPADTTDTDRSILVLLLRQQLSKLMLCKDQLITTCSMFLCMADIDPNMIAEVIDEWQGIYQGSGLWDALSRTAESTSDPITATICLGVVRIGLANQPLLTTNLWKTLLLLCTHCLGRAFVTRGSKSVDQTLASYCVPSQAAAIIDIIVSWIRTKDLSTFVASSSWMNQVAQVAAHATFSGASNATCLPSGYQLKLLNFVVDCCRGTDLSMFYSQYEARRRGPGRVSFLAAVMGMASSASTQPPSTAEQTVALAERLFFFSEATSILHQLAFDTTQGKGPVDSADKHLKVVVKELAARIAKITAPEHWKSSNDAFPRAIQFDESRIPLHLVLPEVASATGGPFSFLRGQLVTKLHCLESCLNRTATEYVSSSEVAWIEAPSDNGGHMAPSSCEVDIPRSESPILVTLPEDAPWLILIDEPIVSARNPVISETNDKGHGPEKPKSKTLSRVVKEEKREKNHAKQMKKVEDQVERVPLGGPFWLDVGPSQRVPIPRWATTSRWIHMLAEHSQEGVLKTMRKQVGEHAGTLLACACDVFDTLPHHMQQQPTESIAFAAEVNIWLKFRRRLLSERPANIGPVEPLHFQEALRFSKPDDKFIYRLDTGVFCSEPLPARASNGINRSRRLDTSVELACIIRDCLSRIPFQIGTFEDLVEELRQSQYVEVPTLTTIRVPFEAKVKKCLDTICAEKDPVVFKLGGLLIYKNYERCIRESLQAFAKANAPQVQQTAANSDQEEPPSDEDWIETRIA